MIRTVTIRMQRCLALAALLLMGACASLTGQKEPFTTYLPRYTPAPAAANAPRVDWQLTIDTPLWLIRDDLVLVRVFHDEDEPLG